MPQKKTKNKSTAVSLSNHKKNCISCCCFPLTRNQHSNSDWWEKKKNFVHFEITNAEAAKLINEKSYQTYWLIDWLTDCHGSRISPTFESNINFCHFSFLFRNWKTQANTHQNAKTCLDVAAICCRFEQFIRYACNIETNIGQKEEIKKEYQMEKRQCSTFSVPHSAIAAASKRQRESSRRIKNNFFALIKCSLSHERSRKKKIGKKFTQLASTLSHYHQRRRRRSLSSFDCRRRTRVWNEFARIRILSPWLYRCNNMWIRKEWKSPGSPSAPGTEKKTIELNHIQMAFSSHSISFIFIYYRLSHNITAAPTMTSCSGYIWYV